MILISLYTLSFLTFWFRQLSHPLIDSSISASSTLPEYCLNPLTIRIIHITQCTGVSPISSIVSSNSLVNSTTTFAYLAS